MNKTPFDRGAIMRRAWEIAHETRAADAQKAHARDVSRIGDRIIHNRTLAAHLAETRVDIASAMKQAWAEAKITSPQPATNRALTIIRAGAPAPRRRLRLGRVIRMAARALRAVPGALRFLSDRFIPEQREVA